MGRAPCCSKVGLLRGPWAAKEDALLTDYIKRHGEGSWRSLPKKAGLLRCGKSCRLRWMNYLRPDIKRGNIGPEEEDLIIRLHSLLGNRWSLIAGRLPGRTDNEIKNYWNGHLSRKLKQQGIEIRERSATKSPSSKRSRKDEKKKKKNEEEGDESAKIKIHAPKPTRFAPILSSNDSRGTSVASEDETGDVSRPDGDADQGSPLVEGDFPASLQNYYGVDCDFEYDLLDRVYQEYSQLLNSGEDQFPFDSFTEALLM